MKLRKQGTRHATAKGDNMTENNLEILAGANAIAAALGLKRRQVYALIDNGHLPTFKLGGTVCARKSTLAKWLDAKAAA